MLLAGCAHQPTAMTTEPTFNPEHTAAIDHAIEAAIAARVFALASRWEGSSIALLEAMVAGTPIVASHTAGDASEVLEHGQYGLLADAQDPAAFAAALLRQIEAPITPGDRVRDYDAERMIAAYHDVITAALSRSGPVTARVDRETRPTP